MPQAAWGCRAVLDRALHDRLGREELLPDGGLRQRRPSPSSLPCEARDLALLGRLQVIKPQAVAGVFVELAVQLAAVRAAVVLADETFVPHRIADVGRQVIDPKMAWIFDDILKDNTDPNGSFVFGPWTNIGRPAALKTGTTDNLQDVLAIGFTPQRLTAIWMGNSDNSEMRGISSALGPGVLWRDYMKTVVGGLPVVWYPRPDGIVTVTVCENPALTGGNGSGELPGPGCPASFRKQENFIAGTEPKKNDSDFYTGCGINLRAPFADWQPYYNQWASGAVSGLYSYGRFSWSICGFAPRPVAPSGAPSPGPSGSGAPAPSGPPSVTAPPRPTIPPPPTKKP